MSGTEVIAERQLRHADLAQSPRCDHDVVDQVTVRRRHLPWPALLLAIVLAGTLALAMRIAEWDDPAPLFHELDLEVGVVSHVDEHCTATTGPAGQLGPTVCRYSIVLQNDSRFVFPYSGTRPSLRPGTSVELRHANGLRVWEVRAEGSVLASYEGVKEFRAQNTRMYRRLGILGCLAMLVIALHQGVRRVRAGPSCCCRACRLFDYTTLVALFISLSAIVRQQLPLAVAGTLVGFASFVIGIDYAARHRHVDVGGEVVRARRETLAGRLQGLMRRVEQWGDSMEAVARDPSRSRALRWAAALTEMLVFFGLMVFHCVSMELFFSLGLRGERVDGLWTWVMVAVAVPAACLLSAFLLGRRVSHHASVSQA